MEAGLPLDAGTKAMLGAIIAAAIVAARGNVLLCREAARTVARAVRYVRSKRKTPGQ